MIIKLLQVDLLSAGVDVLFVRSTQQAAGAVQWGIYIDTRSETVDIAAGRGFTQCQRVVGNVSRHGRGGCGHGSDYVSDCDGDNGCWSRVEQSLELQEDSFICLSAMGQLCCVQMTVLYFNVKQK